MLFRSLCVVRVTLLVLSPSLLHIIHRLVVISTIKHAIVTLSERSITVRTGIALSSTPTPYVADLLFCTGHGRAVFGDDTALGLQKIVSLKKRLVC